MLCAWAAIAKLSPSERQTCYKGAVEPRRDAQAAGGAKPAAEPAERDENRLCLRCGRRLRERSCKLLCDRCGYYLSCSDF